MVKIIFPFLVILVLTFICLIKKTEWQLIEDKLGIQKPFYRNSLHRSALEQFVARGYSLGFNASFSVLRGYLFDPNHNIEAYVRCLGSFSDTLQLLELEAIKHL